VLEEKLLKHIKVRNWLKQAGKIAIEYYGKEVVFSKELIAKRKSSMPVLYGQEKSIEYFPKHVSLR
jgi:hypothetical protein